MKHTFTEIVAFTPGKWVAALCLAVIAHLAIVESSLRQQAATSGAEVKDFWLTNLANGLPYLQTESKTLKFITFFILAYIFVWITSMLFRLLDQAQVWIVAKLRKRP